MIEIIIPTLDEASHLETLLTDLLAREEDVQITIADGGSTDGTWDLAGRFPVRRLRAPRGRAAQMNAGARGATGDLLLFLHADTLLPPGAFRRVAATLAEPDVAGGSFRLTFDRIDPCLAAYAFFSRINHPLFTYGDQALFLRRELFARLGGFREIPIMEDVEIQRRLRREGRFVKLPEAVVTSARRFMDVGPIRQQLLNLALVGLYHLGVAPDRLKRLYADARPHLATR